MRLKRLESSFYEGKKTKTDGRAEGHNIDLHENTIDCSRLSSNILTSAEELLTKSESDIVILSRLVLTRAVYDILKMYVNSGQGILQYSALSSLLYLSQRFSLSLGVYSCVNSCLGGCVEGLLPEKCADILAGLLYNCAHNREQFGAIGGKR